MQNIMAPVCVVNLVVFLLCPLFFQFFVRHLGWGLRGAAMANNAAVATTAVCLFTSACWIHMRHPEDHPQRRAWPGVSTEALKARTIQCSVLSLRAASQPPPYSLVICTPAAPSQQTLLCCALQGWAQFMRYGVPSCLMMCLEWWLFEIARCAMAPCQQYAEHFDARPHTWQRVQLHCSS